MSNSLCVILAAPDRLPLLALLGSACLGAAVYVLARTLRNSLHTEDLAQDDQWRYDVGRINELRRVSLLYRVFQPVIQGFAVVDRRMSCRAPNAGGHV